MHNDELFSTYTYLRKMCIAHIRKYLRLIGVCFRVAAKMFRRIPETELLAPFLPLINRILASVNKLLLNFLRL